MLDNSTTLRAQNVVVVADSSCPQILELLREAEAPVLWLDGQEPPLKAVSRALAERRTLGKPIDTLHWVSHGQPGQLQLGASRINSGTLLANAHNLASWGISSLALWSCNAGADHAFIALWEELTGASLWSSSDVLGRLDDNGISNWSLSSRITAAAPPTLPIATPQLLSWHFQLAFSAPDLDAASDDGSSDSDNDTSFRRQHSQAQEHQQAS